MALAVILACAASAQLAERFDTAASHDDIAAQDRKLQTECHDCEMCANLEALPDSCDVCDSLPRGVCDGYSFRPTASPGYSYRPLRPTPSDGYSYRPLRPTPSDAGAFAAICTPADLSACGEVACNEWATLDKGLSWSGSNCVRDAAGHGECQTCTPQDTQAVNMLHIRLQLSSSFQDFDVTKICEYPLVTCNGDDHYGVIVPPNRINSVDFDVAFGGLTMPHLTSITVPNAGFTGTLPDSLAESPEMKSFDICGNSIGGGLPASFVEKPWSKLTWFCW